MNANSAEYRQWKVKQNAKNLKRRTEKRARIRARRGAQISCVESQKPDAVYSAKLDRKPIRNSTSLDFITPMEDGWDPCCAPEILDFTTNIENTVGFFTKLIAFTKQLRVMDCELHIDLSQIQSASLDALLYLLAIVNDLALNYADKFRFINGLPQSNEVRASIENVGLDRFINNFENLEVQFKSENTRIFYGKEVLPDLAGAILDFVCEKATVELKKYTFLYTIIIELMANTHNHAYKTNDCILSNNWYCLSHYNAQKSSLFFAFVDTGDGIPATVRKYFSDYLLSSRDSEYVISALKGDVRTHTKQKNRGTGLPLLLSACTNRSIQHMEIVTNRANVTIHETNIESVDLSAFLNGTVFSWSINLT